MKGVGATSSAVRDIDRVGPSGWNFQTCFGRRTLIPVNSTAVVWGGTSPVRPLPLAPMQMAVRSTSALDTFGNPTGAQLLGVSFIDGNGDWRMSDYVVMNGLTNVLITYDPNNRLNTQGGTFTQPGGSSVPALIYRVIDVVMLTVAGVTQANPFASNIGTISVYDNATKLVEFDAMRIGRGRANSCSFHIPRGFRGRLTHAPVGSASGPGAFWIFATFGPGTATQALPLCTVNASAALFSNDAFCTPIASRSDVTIVVDVGSNNTDATALMQIRLEPFP